MIGPGEPTLAACVGELGLLAGGLDRRVASAGITPADRDHLRALGERLDDRLESFAAEFYAGLRGDPETQHLLLDDTLVARLRASHREHLRSLFAARFDAEYAAERARVGLVHHAIGVHPRWYVTAWRRHTEWVTAQVPPTAGQESGAVAAMLAAFQKAVSLDMGITLDAHLLAERWDSMRSDEVLRRMAEGVSSAVGTPLFEAMVTQLSAVLEADIVFVSEIDDGVETRAIAAAGRGKPIAPFAYQMVNTPCAEAIELGGPVRVETGAVERYPDAPLLQQLEADCVYIAPLLDDDGTAVGLLAIANSTTIPGLDRAEWVIRIFAARAASEILRMRAERATEAVSGHLREAQRLEAIGRLAGGIAHDFNNVLTSIIGYADRVGRKVEGDPDLDRYVASILSAAEHAGALTKQLLAFARQQVLDPRVVDLDDILRDMLPLIEPLLGEDVRVQLDLTDAGSTVRADPDQLRQVVMNLAVNAREAMPGGGSLRIATTRQHRPDQGAPGSGGLPGGLPAGHFVQLAVSDTGVGMGEDTAAHVFEPFFTRRKGGGGTGMGLATVYGIVKQSGGFITVQSEKGKGATFTVLLPYAPARPPDTAPGYTPPSGDGSITVLVVEDEPAVRSLIVESLEEEGYRVLSAGDAETALAGLLADWPVPDLALSD